VKWKREAYLKAFGDRLRHVQQEDRLDAIREIDSTIADGLADGLSEEAILNRLGDPVRLAGAYQSDYLLQSGSGMSLMKLWHLVGFYSTTGLLSAMLVPLIATIAYGFGFVAVIAPIAGLLRTFGASWVSMSLFGPNDVPTAWSLPFSLLLALLLGAIAYGAHRLLLRYFRFVSRQHRKLSPR
jgi:uncharacterized membrane protein